ncbi:hypothetical protein TNCV_4531581 [Trichonephila clavipes]|nr:hypothetical protein TNCV_4531581 [Trichonephila clavipes]
MENVWDALGRQVSGRNYPPTNKNTLIRALTGEWDKLPQQLLDNVVQSMPGPILGYRGSSSLVVKVTDSWLAYHVISSPVPLKTHRVGAQCTLNLSRARTSTHWCGVAVRRGGTVSGVVLVT